MNLIMIIPFHSEYFDVDPSVKKGQAQAKANVDDTARVGHGQQMNADDRQPARDP
jgi:hypothetical protein